MGRNGTYHSSLSAEKSVGCSALFEKAFALAEQNAAYGSRSQFSPKAREIKDSGKELIAFISASGSSPRLCATLAADASKSEVSVEELRCSRSCSASSNLLNCESKAVQARSPVSSQGPVITSRNPTLAYCGNPCPRDERY